MTTPKAPKTLSKEAAGWWRKLQAEYSIEDEAGRLLLQTALESFDRMRQCQETIKAEGQTVLDRFQQAKAHPLLATERDARSQMMQALKQLNLDIEISPHPGPGRPPGK
ncbi:MAG: phage terminase small subunit P27 family [Desulfobacteraceae bacterium]|nr:phage terminase small subunit P27 family [Desulfobacteraceae bacterium]